MARHLGMPVTTAADYVRAMQSRGHLRKEPHPDDSRAHLLALTPAGVRAHRTANARFERAYRAIVKELPPLDEAQARDVLQLLTASAARATERLANS
jgi:DNA-binding MarR family transcriptional regulator